MSVPHTLRRAKDAAGETNRSLAEKSGVPEHTVAKIMSGATPSPTFDQVAAMAAVLDLDLYRERLAVYDRGVRQRNLVICALLGFLAFFATAFVIYVIMDANDPQHGFIRPDTPVSPWIYLSAAVPILGGLIAGHIFASRRVKADRNKK